MRAATEVLGQFPVCSWKEFPSPMRSEFVAACITIGAKRLGRAVQTPDWLIAIVTTGYDRGDAVPAIAREVLSDARFEAICPGLNHDRRPLLAEMIARDPISRITSRLTHAAALANDDLLRIVSPTPVCHRLDGELAHLMLDRGRSVSTSDLLPPLWCTNVVCRCEYRAVDGPGWYRRIKARRRVPK